MTITRAEALARFEDATIVVAEILRRLGWEITPRDIGQTGFVATRDGERRWIEPKSKQDRVYFALWQRYVHGISLDNWRTFQIKQQRKQIPVWIVIVEWKRGNVLCQTIDELAAPGRCRMFRGPGENDIGGSIYFDVAAFRLLGKIQEAGYED